MNKPRFTFWKLVLGGLLLAGAYALTLRFVRGLGASTNLSDAFPWGLWVGFKLFSVALAGGGFTLAAVVHIFNLKRYQPILRPIILTAFLGYSMFIISLIIDLGRPYRVWHPLVMWNDHSVMFEIAWCVMLYTTVLLLEFIPALFERLKWKRALSLVHGITIPVVIAGVILSTLHQSSLGSLYLIVPGKLYPLWYSPFEPVFFFLSAVCAGIAMVIFESWHSSKAFGKQLELPLLVGLGRVLAVALSVYVTVRILDMVHRGVFHLLVLPRTETYLFLLEAALLVTPMLLLFWTRVHQRLTGLYLCSVLTLLGVVTNRMNVAITGMEASSGTYYFPRWTEFAITLSLVASAFALFALAVKYLPVFPQVRESGMFRVAQPAPGVAKSRLRAPEFTDVRS
ncbi:MAG TPA: Ni/Fe-hydrogenase cytochrome b subunit [Terriglobales bacterium]|nr:Ni/Fe-hydrogenase cytochrome b subunit [Terriglobales bacterium]